MDNPETIEETRPETGPGHLLTEARLKLGLELQNVAEMLHLRGRQIIALEADDYESLPEPTYVKGYLRAYCHLLSLEPDVIVKNYSDFVAPPVKEPTEELAPEKTPARNEDMVKLVSIVMVGLVAGLVAIFWFSSKSESPPATMPVAISSPIESIDQTTSDQTSSTMPGKSVAEQSETTNKLDAISGSKSMKANATEPSTTLPQTDPAKVDTVDSKKFLPVKPPRQVATIAQPENSTAGIRNEVSLLPETDEFTRTRLLIKIIDNSWVDIRDARGNKLIYETVPAGREIPLEGMAPFKVFLGNASGVKVFLEGEEYDITPHQRGLTARFTLKSKSETQ